MTPATATYQVVDLMPLVGESHQQARGLEPRQQAQLFKAMVADRHLEAFAGRVIGIAEDRPWEPALHARYEHWLAQSTPAQIATAQRLSASIRENLATSETKFRAAFPDFGYAGKLYFMPSLLGFDGATRTIDGQTALLFGVDTMAAICFRVAEELARRHSKSWRTPRWPRSSRGSGARSRRWRERLGTEPGPVW